VTLSLLGTAVVAGLLSTMRPRSRWHWISGIVSLAGQVATLFALPSAQGEYWVVLMASLVSVAVNGFGLSILLARRHPRRPHRHIIYCGYGLVFTTIALCWAVAARYPGRQHDLLATVASAGVYLIGSVGIGLYKARQTLDAYR
jgi:hypothetical protein